MNDKLVSLNAVIDELEKANWTKAEFSDGEERFAIALYDAIWRVKNLPAVPQEMSAREYEKVKDRMRRSNGTDNAYGLYVRALFEGQIDEAVAIVEKWVEEHPERTPVPQEMNAVEFLNEYERMCKVNCGSTTFKCSTECPIFAKVKGYLLKCQPWVIHHPNEAVAIVEKWAREHPKEDEE